MKKFYALVTLVCLASPVQAAPITEPTDLVGPVTTVTFDSIPLGAVPASFSTGGITVDGAFQAFNVAAFPAAGSFPNYVGGVAIGQADTDPADPNLRITFDGGPVAQVGLGLFDQNFDTPHPNTISAYSVGGVLLESTTPDVLFPPGGSGADYVGFVRGAADIAYIEIVAASGDALWFDNVSFSQVSVPAPAGLLILLTALGLFARRRA